MKKCDNCTYTHDKIIITITDGVKTIQLCPNCLARLFMENEISFINNPDFICDVTGKPGAVKFTSIGEEYYLERRSMMRLISYNLKKNEYLALAKKYGPHGFMIHEDFYWKDGTALQPIK